jgi:hypothetical protein
MRITRRQFRPVPNTFNAGSAAGLAELLEHARGWDGLTAFAALDLALDERDWEPPWCGSAKPAAPHRAVRAARLGTQHLCMHCMQHNGAQVLAVEAWLASRPLRATLIALCARRLAVKLLPRALDRLVRFRHANRAVRFVTRALGASELSKAELVGPAPAELFELFGLSAAATQATTRAYDSAGPAVHACNRARLGFCCAAPEAWVGAQLGGPADEIVQLVRRWGVGVYIG